MKAEILSLLNLGSEESILFHKRLTLNIAFYKNNKRKIRKDMIITNHKLLFIDYLPWIFGPPKHIREIDVIPISEIISVVSEMRHIHLAKRPFFEITKRGCDTFGLAFSSFGNYGDEMKKIEDLLKLANSDIHITTNITQMPWKGFE